MRTREAGFLLTIALVALGACGGDRASSPVPTPVPEAEAQAPPTVRAGLVESSAASAFEAHREQTLVALFTPDGEHVLTAGLDGDVRLWTRDGRPVATLRGHKASVHGAVFSPDGARVATASVDGTTRIWDLERARDGRDAAVGVLPGDTREIAAVVTARGGNRLVTLSLGGRAKIGSWDGRVVAGLREKEADVERVYLSPAADRIVTLAPDAESRLWDGDGTLVATLDAHATEGDGARFSPDGRHVAVWGPRAEVAIYDAEGTRTARLEGHEAQVLDLAFLPGGDRLVTASLDGTARLWSLAGEELAVLRGHQGGVFQVTVSASGERIATVSSDGTARLWTREGEPIGDALRAEGTAFGDAHFAPAGDALLLRHRRAGGAEIRDAQGRLTTILPDASGRTSRVAWSPDGTRVVRIDRRGTPAVLRVEGDDREEATVQAARPGTTAFDGPPARGDYAGTVVCASCHRDAYEGWRRSSHALDVDVRAGAGAAVRGPGGRGRAGTIRAGRSSAGTPTAGTAKRSAKTTRCIATP